MNRLLPKTKNNQNGFTLVELLVVIVILAILGIVGLTIFTGTQSKARDAKRKEDISAMAAAMEANYAPGVGYPLALQGSWFADLQIPTNPGPTGASYSTAASAMTTSSWVFCALLEGTPSTGNATSAAGAGLGTTTTGSWFCKRNAQ